MTFELNNKNSKGITLIALVITIIVLIILAGISINLVLGENGLFNKAKSASVETKKARFVEDAGLAYSEAYIDMIEKTDSNTITIGDVVEKLKLSYGYTEEQIKTVSSGVTDIKLSETKIKIETNGTKEVQVTLENGTYYVQIQDLYYPITISNSEITLGEGIESLPEGEETTNKIEATTESEIIDVAVKDSTITITAKDGKTGEATIIVTYGKITKTITVTVKDEVKQGDEVDLGEVTVEVNSELYKLEQGWKYFYEEDNKVWLIYNGILEGDLLQTSETIKSNDNGVNSSKDRQDLIDYLNGEGNYLNAWEHIKNGIKNVLEAKGISVTEEQIQVKGSLDIELLEKAFTKMYPDYKLEIHKNNIGWQYRFGETEEFDTEVYINEYINKTLFFINGHYWLASPSSNTISGVCNVYSNGMFTGSGFNYTGIGARPIVSIPKAVFEKLVC